VFKWLPDSSKVTKAPLKVTFDGIPPGSPEAHHFGEALRPQINHFLTTQTQQQRLSGREVYKVRRSYPGLTMTYSHNHGQETLRVIVETSLAEKLLSVIEDFWDFALIELYIPNIYPAETLGLICFAHITAPLQMEITPETAAAFPIRGVAASYSTLIPEQTATDPLINPALPPPVFVKLDDSPIERYASFTLDLRPLKRSAVTVALHPMIIERAAIYPVTAIWTPLSNQWSEDPDPGFPPEDYDINMVEEAAGPTVWGSTAGIAGTFMMTHVNTNIGTEAGFVDYPWPTTTTDYPGEGTMTWAHLPETYFDPDDLTWKFVDTDSPFYNQYAGERRIDFDG
jgi:hypothetical protein